MVRWLRFKMAVWPQFTLFWVLFLVNNNLSIVSAAAVIFNCGWSISVNRWGNFGSGTVVKLWYVIVENLWEVDVGWKSYNSAFSSYQLDTRLSVFFLHFTPTIGWLSWIQFCCILHVVFVQHFLSKPTFSVVGLDVRNGIRSWKLCCCDVKGFS